MQKIKTMAFKHSTKHNITHYIEILKSQAVEAKSRNDS